MRAEAHDYCSTFADYQTGKVGELLSVETADERVCPIVYFLLL